MVKVPAGIRVSGPNVNPGGRSGVGVPASTGSPARS
jgi:hypothetical protein